MTSYTSPFGNTYLFNPAEVKDAAMRQALAKAAIAQNSKSKANAARQIVAEAELTVAETAHILANGPALWNEENEHSWSYWMSKLTSTSSQVREKMQKSIADNGFTYSMRRYGESVMLEEAANDLASRLAAMIADKTPSEAFKVLVDFQGWMQEKILSWYPSRSTSAITNLAEDQQHKAIIDIARELQWNMSSLKKLAEAYAIAMEQN